MDLDKIITTLCSIVCTVVTVLKRQPQKVVRNETKGDCTSPAVS